MDSSSLTWQRSEAAQPTQGFDPIDNDMENEEQRFRSFRRNNGWRGAVDPRKLAAAGFYYTGIHDNVTCFECDLSLSSWAPGEDPVREHLKNRPNCSFISRLGNKFSVSYLPSVSLQDTRSSWPKFAETHRSFSHDPSMGYRLSSPALPHTNLRREPVPKPNYANEHARLHSFINWPKTCPVQPKELIDAGFYYRGNGDKVECFKCGIILAGWEPLDTPWGEHEKWSKDCPLVIEHRRRRNPRSPVQGSGPLGLPQEQTWTTPPKSSDCSLVVSLPEKKEDMKALNVVRLPEEQSECSKASEQNWSSEDGREEEIFYLAKGVQKLMEDGQFNYETISEAIQQRTKIEGVKINSMTELLDAIHSYEAMSAGKETSIEDPKRVFSSIDDTASTSAETGGFSLSVDPAALRRQVQKMEDAHRCKICLDAEIGIVFLPCGHLVCCPKCAHEIQSKRDSLCPICRRHISDIIRTYIT